MLGPCLATGGYCSKMARAVVFGPTETGGMDWDNPILIYLYGKLKILIGSVRLQDTVGKLIKIQLSWLQVFAGISTPILEYDKEITYIPNKWMKTLHQLLVQYQVKIKLHEIWTPIAQRKNDRIIMQYIIENIPDWAWDSINTCRLFLRATTVANLAMIDGKYIPDQIKPVKAPLRENNVHFPLQARPSKQDVEKWLYFID